MKDLYTENYKTLIKIREDGLKKYTIFGIKKKKKERKTNNLIKKTGMWVRAKSLQLCLTLRDPMDCNPPVSSVPGIL